MRWPLLLLYVVTALRLGWLLCVDAFYFYGACREQLAHCQQYDTVVTDNAAFRADCRQFEALGTPLLRTTYYMAGRCIDTSNDDVLPYLLVAALVSFLVPRLWRDWLLPYCERRRVQVDNYRYRAYVAGRKPRAEGLNVEL